MGRLQSRLSKQEVQFWLLEHFLVKEGFCPIKGCTRRLEPLGSRRWWWNPGAGMVIWKMVMSLRILVFETSTGRLSGAGNSVVP